MPKLELMILIGAFAQNYYLKEKTLAERVEDYKIKSISQRISLSHILPN
jgi:uracil-DNA glycosylase